MKQEVVTGSRNGLDAEIAIAILFYDSDLASYINGHQLIVGGGVINSVFVQQPRT